MNHFRASFSRATTIRLARRILPWVRRSLGVGAVVLLAACGDDADPTGLTQTGSIRGTVTDGGGGAVAHAGIELVGNEQDARTTSTGNDGVYTFADVPPGTYTLTVTPPTGFTVGAPATTTITVTSETQSNAPPFVLSHVTVVDSCAIVRPDFDVATAAELELFAYSVSHDLRSPLRGIQGLATVLVENSPPLSEPQRQEFLERIARNAEQMQTLIDDLLEYSRLKSAELPIQR